jgi:hypothetical protein
LAAPLYGVVGSVVMSSSSLAIEALLNLFIVVVVNWRSNAVSAEPSSRST